MKRSVALVAGLALTVVSSPQWGSAAVQKKGGATATVHALGVCTITPEAVSCWDTAGHRDQALTQRVTREIEAIPELSLPVAYHRAIRFVVVSKDPTVVGFGVTPQVQGLGVDLLNNSSTKPTIGIVPVFVDHGGQTFRIKGAYYIDSIPPSKIAFKNGARARVGGVDYRIDWIRPTPVIRTVGWWNGFEGVIGTPSWVPLGDHYFLRECPQWILSRVDGKSSGDQVTLNALTRDGKIVTRIDMDGAISAAEYHPDWVAIYANQRSSDSKKKESVATVLPVTRLPGANLFESNIRQSDLHVLQLSVYQAHEVTLEGLPTNPIPSAE